ncbi:MAG: sugar-transfer associated ATP-grasp domain-containing protein [Lachnospiraceae bacterium]
MMKQWKYRLLPPHLKTRWSYEDYLHYRMQEMTYQQIEQFMTPEELWDAEKHYNQDAGRCIFNSKRLFYSHFPDFIYRDFLDLQKTDENVFLEFLKKHEKVILKPDALYAGIGIKLYDAKNKTVDCPDFQWLKENDYLAEEYICQDEAYEAIYPHSLNTVRVTTLRNESTVQILFVANQFGSQNSIVDNADDTAIWAIADPDTGIVTYPDRNMQTGLLWEKHPDTGEAIVGFQNPHFKDILEIAKQAANRVPQCRLVGWDVAVRRDGRIEIVEGNVTPELDLYQVISGHGLREQLSWFGK